MTAARQWIIIREPDEDAGGSAQFIAHVGVAFALTDRLHAGVRHRHLSDGEMHEVGEDLNLLLLEVFSDFNE